MNHESLTEKIIGAAHKVLFTLKPGLFLAARMGAVQINPRHPTATTLDGNCDASTVDKAMTVTASATFSLK